ncbi:tetratricopeptide repeat protein [Adhaeribacter aquaticus]|uniref:tetratricopeptide repeat protein n=1 Tax=Adhaeribacter aquaticus TaxID=299567 RepID=UPI000417BBC1|nr:tetratricopeptide repeat protein [Adhaeribacter aquaticus]
MILSKYFFVPCLGLALLLAGPGYGQKKQKKNKAETPAEQPLSFAQKDKKLDNREKEASESFFIEGMKYMMLEDFPKALERFQRAYAINSSNAALNYKIAQTIMQMGRANEALPFAQAAVNIDSSNPYYYLLLAQLFGGQNRYDDAIKVLTKLTKELPNTDQYLFQLADLYLAQNKYEDALKTYDRIEKQYGFIEEIAYKKQQIYLRQNNLEKALKEGEQLISSDPNEIRFTLAQAEMLANNKKTDEAIVLVNKALKAEKNNAQAHLMLAELYRQKGNLAESEKELKLAFGNPGLEIDTKVKILIDYIRQMPVPPAKADPDLQDTALELADLTIKTHPTEAKAYAVAGDVQALAQKKTDARTNYLKALKLDNSHFKIWQQVIFLEAELAQTDSLVVHTEKALELFPNQAMLWFYNGTAYMLKKEPARAIKSLEYGKKLTIDNAELQNQFNIQLGDSYQSLKDYPKSDAAYESVLAADPNNPHVLNNYSYYLSLRGQNLDKAKSMSEKLVKQNPKEATYLDTHAWVLYKLKEYKEARKYLEEAVSLKKDADILEHYGDVLYQLGEKELALEQWKKAKQIGKASDLIDKKIKDKKLYE